MGFWQEFWFGFLKVLPLYLVSYIVGLGIEFASAQIRNEEVNEGYLVSGMLIPLIVPVDVPLWILVLAVAFAVIFGKEVFGGTGMNIWNPALLTRAFLFFAYPSKMSGSAVWISLKQGQTMIDGATGATPLTFASEGMDAMNNAGVQYGMSFWDMFAGIIPGSVGETSVIAILIGAVILLWTGVASWKIMCSSVIGALFVGWLGTAFGATDVPAYYQLVMGGFAFGTVFMATDPVTSAQTECGKWIYGFLIGALCVTVRLFNPGYAEGMMLAILLMNTCAPLIDHCVIESSISRRAKKVKVA
jgi:Na+-transporting NADH:ubiquinone oxidoreductase subunit B